MSKITLKHIILFLPMMTGCGSSKPSASTTPPPPAVASWGTSAWSMETADGLYKVAAEFTRQANQQVEVRIEITERGQCAVQQGSATVAQPAVADADGRRWKTFSARATKENCRLAIPALPIPREQTEALNDGSHRRLAGRQDYLLLEGDGAIFQKIPAAQSLGTRSVLLQNEQTDRAVQSVGIIYDISTKKLSAVAINADWVDGQTGAQKIDQADSFTTVPVLIDAIDDKWKWCRAQFFKAYMIPANNYYGDSLRAGTVPQKNQFNKLFQESLTKFEAGDCRELN